MYKFTSILISSDKPNVNNDIFPKEIRANYNLPICPECKDTKFVERRQSCKLEGGRTLCLCTKCDIDWYIKEIEFYHE